MSVLSLIATLALGAVAGFFVWAGFKTFKRKPPRFLVPATIGTTIIAYNIWIGYSWYGRMVDEFPDGVRVVQTYETSVFWEPWTYLVPRINRFDAIDAAKTRRNPQHPDMRMVELLLVQRLGSNAMAQQLVDCRKGRIMDITAKTVMGEDGLPVKPAWVDLDPGHPLVRAACGE